MADVYEKGLLLKVQIFQLSQANVNHSSFTDYSWQRKSIFLKTFYKGPCNKRSRLERSERLFIFLMNLFR